MSKNSQNYTRTVTITGQLDTSQILSKVQQLRTELQGKASQADLLGIDTEINKLSTLESKIKSAIDKGFSNDAELKDFDRMMSKFLVNADRLGTRFSKITLKGLTEDVTAAQQKVTTLSTQLAAMTKNMQKTFQSGFTSKSFGNQVADEFTKGLQAGEKFETVVERINKQLNQIAGEKQIQLEYTGEQKDKANKRVTDITEDKIYYARQSQGNITAQRFSKVTTTSSKTETTKLSEVNSELLKAIDEKIAVAAADSTKDAIKVLIQDITKENDITISNDDIKKIAEQYYKAYNKDSKQKSINSAKADVDEKRKKVSDFSQSDKDTLVAAQTSAKESYEGKSTQKNLEALNKATKAVNNYQAAWDKANKELEEAETKLANITSEEQSKQMTQAATNTLSSAALVQTITPGTSTVAEISKKDTNTIKEFFDEAIKGAKSADEAFDKFKASLASLTTVNDDGSTTSFEIKNEEGIKSNVDKAFTSKENGLVVAQEEAAALELQYDSLEKEIAEVTKQQEELNKVEANSKYRTSYEGAQTSQTNLESAWVGLAEAEINKEAGKGIEEVNKLGEAVDNLSDDYARESLQVNAAAEQQNKFNEKFENIKMYAQRILSLTTAYTQLRQIITQTFQDVQTLDKAFAEIAMVSDYSVEDMWGMYDSYSQMANELGQTTESVIQASGLYIQQGFAII